METLGLTEERRALLDEMERSALCGSWVWWVTEERVEWSDELYRILGYDQGTHEATLESFFARIHPDDLPSMQEDSDRIAGTGESFSRVARIVRPDGRIRNIRTTSRQISATDGSPLRMVGTIVDITENVAQAEELESTLLRMNEAQRLARVGSWVLHADSGEMEWSDEMFRLCGQGASDFNPSVNKLLELIHREDRSVFENGLKAALAGEPEPFECRLRSGEEQKFVSFHSKVESQSSGATERLHGTMIDLTERKTLEVQLRQSQKMEALGQLAGGVAHDLNNYLQIIAGNVDLLEQYQPEDVEDVALAQADIQTSLKLCSALTRGLLAFSRQQSVEPQSVDLHDTIKHSVDLLSKLLGADVKTSTALHAQRTRVHCDPHQMEQVLFNLAVNARDAMDGKGKLSISTANLESDDHGDGHFVIRVQDTGRGMTEEVAAKIFDPFFTTKPVGHGTGLGLSTVYGIVEQNGGVIRVESQPGVGTSFIIKLPLHRAKDDTATGSAPSSGASSDSPCILIAEDEPMVRRMTVRSLKRAGYSVLEAPDGQKAFEILRSPEGKRVALVLSDVIMPNMSGVDLLEKMEEEELETPILLMTGFADQERVEQAGPRVGKILHKPFSRADLLQAISEVFEDAPVQVSAS